MSIKTDKTSLKVCCPFCQARLDLSDLPSFSQISCPKCAAAMTVPRWFQNILLEEVLDAAPGLQVFRALDSTLDREACVKLMRSDNATECPIPEENSPYQESHLSDFLEMFRKMSLLVHPNIVPVCSCGAIEGAVYGVTRYIDGTALNRTSGSGFLPEWKQVQAHSKAALEAMRYAQQKELVHGHLTPENMLVDQHGMLFISDFMIAHSAKKDIAGEAWTAPEIANGQEPNCKSDLFSLAVCLYEFATGTLPCPQETEKWRAGAVSPTSPSQLNQSLPESFSSILLRMMAINPEERFSSFAEAQEALSRLGKGPGRAWQRKQAHAHKLLLPKSQKQPQLRLVNSHKRKKKNPINILITIMMIIAIVLAATLGLRQKPVQDKLHKIGLLKDGKLNLQTGPKKNISASLLAKYADQEEQTEDAEKERRQGFLLPPEVIAARPRPSNYDFKSVREQIQSYLALMPEEAKETEKERLRYLASYKPYLLSKISKMAYSPKNPKGILLRSGEQVSGNVTMFSNETAIKIRQNQKDSSNLREILWEELPPSQVLEMAYSYVERNTAEIKGVKQIPRKKLGEIYDEFFYLILLAEWYQENDTLKQLCGELELLPIDDVRDKLCKYISWSD